MFFFQIFEQNGKKLDLLKKETKGLLIRLRINVSTIENSLLRIVLLYILYKLYVIYLLNLYNLYMMKMQM